MFGGGFNSSKLKTNTRLCINRLKLLQKKKTELNVKARKEIAEYLRINKDDRARIKVEQIIRDDYLIEAMECVELYCDLIIARMGLIESQKYCDEGLQTPICTLIWIAPRMQDDVAELKQIADLLSSKFGKEFATQARNNQNGAVDDRIKNKITMQQPSAVLVEQYLIEIANAHNVEFEPCQQYLGGDDFLGSNFGGGSFGGGGGGGGGGGNIPAGSVPPAPGFAGFNDLMTGPPQMDPPPLPGNAVAYSQDHSNQDFQGKPGNTTVPTPRTASLPPPPGAQSCPPAPFKPSLPASLPPAMNPASAPPGSAPPHPPSYNESFELPNLPSVPQNNFLPPGSSSTNSAAGGDDEFDDLNKRFEELKKRKF